MTTIKPTWTSLMRAGPVGSREVLAAADACVRSYTVSTHVRFNSEALLENDTFAVRGTTAAFGHVIRGDWGMNSLALPWRSSDYPDLGWCHKGFMRGGGWGEPGGALGLWNVAKHALMFSAPKTICGHSKGGAEAIILAALCVLTGNPPVALVTFGAPKVTTETRLFELLSDVPQTHFVHGDDIVPAVPCAGWWLDPPRDRLSGGREHRLSDSITDHFMSAYRCAVYTRYGLGAAGTCPVV